MLSFLARCLGSATCLLASVGLTTAQTYELSDPPPVSSLTRAQMVGVTPDGSRVIVSVALAGWTDRSDLYSMRVDGSGGPVGLSTPLPDGVADDAGITGDGSRVVFRTVAGDLYSAPVDGAELPLLLRSNVSNERIRLSPTGATVAYVASGPGGLQRLYSTTADGTGPTVLVSESYQLFPYGTFEVSPDWSRAVFQGKASPTDPVALVSARIDGTGSPVVIAPSSFFVPSEEWKISFDSLGVAFLEAHWDPTVAEHIRTLFVVPIDGSSAPVQRSGAMIPAGSVSSFVLSSVDDLLLYVADQETDDVAELYAVHAIAGGTPLKLNAPFSSSWDASNVVLSADARYASYSVDSIYAVRTDGTTPAVALAAYNGGYLVSFVGDRALYGSHGVLYTFDLAAGGPALELGPQRFLSPFVLPGPVLDDDSVLVAVRADGLAAFELYRVALDGLVAPQRLAGPLVSISDVRVTAAQDRAVFLGAPRTDLALDTWSVPVNGGLVRHLGQSPLNGDVFGGVGPFSISADGSRAVYEVQGTGGLASAPCARTHASVPIGDALGGLLGSASLSPDGSWVVYVQRMGFAPGVPFRLFAARGDGLSEPVLLDGSVESGMARQWNEARIAPGGARVVYLRSAMDGSSAELCSVALDGSDAPIVLFAPSGGESFAPPFASGSPTYVFDTTSDRIVFAVGAPGPTGVGLRRLYSVAPSGAAPALALTSTFTTRIINWSFSVAAGEVVYHSDQDTAGKVELFGVPVDGSSAPLKLSQPMPTSSNDVASSQLSPDGTRVVYLADADIDERVELYSAPTDGSGPVVKLNGTLVPSGDVQSFVIDRSSTRVVYAADQEIDNRRDLYGVAIDGGKALKIGGTTTGNGVGLYTVGAGRVAFVKSLVGGGAALLSAPLDGSAEPFVVHSGLPGTFLLDPRGTSVAFQADSRLVLAPLDAPGPARVLTPILDGLASFQFSPDERRVLFLAAQGAEVPRLFASLIPRAEPRVRLR